MAGGNTFEVFNAGAYNDTVNAKQGDLGTKVLKPRPSGTVWKRGTVARTRWELTASHAGGYQYRLCPAGSTLDEACFSKTPLALAKPYKHTVIMKNREWPPSLWSVASALISLAVCWQPRTTTRSRRWLWRRAVESAGSSTPWALPTPTRATGTRPPRASTATTPAARAAAPPGTPPTAPAHAHAATPTRAASPAVR